MSPTVFVCGGDACYPDDTSDCPQRDQHTPSPRGYVDWSQWAASMVSRGARQARCPGCGLFAIWIGGRS